MPDGDRLGVAHVLGRVQPRKDALVQVAERLVRSRLPAAEEVDRLQAQDGLRDRRGGRKARGPVDEADPLKTGFAFVPMVLAVMLGATGSSGLARIGPRIPIFVGLLLAVVGMVLFAQLELASSDATNILPGLVITGIGIGLAVAPALSAATSGVDTEHSGVASAFVNVVQQVGGSIGIAVLSAFAASAATNYLDGKPASAANQALAALESYTTVFWWAAGIFAVGAVMCGALLRSGPIALDPDAAPVAAH